MKKLLYILVFAALAVSCGKEPQGDGGINNDHDIEDVVTPEEPDQEMEVVKIQSSLTLNLSTNKVLYSPGEAVWFKTDDMPEGAKVRYRRMGETMYEHDLAYAEWSWRAPSTDGVGYMIEVWSPVSETEELIHGTIAVDVSSDWSLFPRYGFVSDFGKDKLTEGVIEEEMAFLNRCHINGIQFYDWHNKHHWPLGGTMQSLLEVYKDIANRDVYNAAIKKYINVQHKYGMKSMFYNLALGVLEGAKYEGVKEEWSLLSGTNRAYIDKHSLPSDWKSDIFLVNPGNPEWQAYLIERNKEVYHHFDFDGFHIDQLGNRGIRYDWNGHYCDLPTGYVSFLNAMKEAHPDKRLVFNAVSGFGGNLIAGSQRVDFCYNEVWGDEDQFDDLYMTIKDNDRFSNHSCRTVFAAYMNYECNDRQFNPHGVLLTDAVMFALGGAHLELGSHMLCREYFPYKGVTMSEELKVQIVRYYDFMTAYQNLLRGESSKAEVKVEVLSDAVSFNCWPPKQGTVTTYSKKVGDRTVVNFLNFISVDNLSWRDTKGARPAPEKLSDTSIKIKYDGKAERVWMATPDQHAGAVQDLAFIQKDGYIYLDLPYLEYWTMLVIE